MKCFPKSWNYRIEALERRWLLATIFWDGGGDNFRFMDPENWSTNTVPGAQDDVIISVPGSLSVLFVPPNQLAPFPIRSLVCDEELLILGILQIETTADINGHLRLQSGSIQGGEWDVGGGDFTCDDSTANRIIGASVIGDIRLGGGLRSRVAIMDNATFTRVRMAATEFASLGFEPGSTFQGIVRMEQGDCGIGVTSPG